MAKQQKRPQARSEPDAESWAVYARVGWLLGAGLWLLVATALVTYHPQDPPSHVYGQVNEPVANWIGTAGARLSHELYLLLGPGVWVVMVGLAVLLAVKVIGGRLSQLLLRAIGVALVAVAGSALWGVAAKTVGGAEPAVSAASGGLLAVYINDHLLPRFAVVGTVMIEGLVALIGALLAADQLVLAVPRAIGRGLVALGTLPEHLRDLSPRQWLPAMPGLPALPRPRLAALGIGTADAEPAEVSPGSKKAGRSRAKRRQSEEAPIDEDAGGLGGTESFNPADYEAAEEAPAFEPEEDGEAEDEPVEEVAEAEAAEQAAGRVVDEAAAEEDEEEAGGHAPETYVAEKKRFDPDQLRAKMANMPINFAPRHKQKTPQRQQEPDLSGYQFPGLDLLAEPERDFSEEMEKIVREQAVELEQALQQYKISGEVVGIDSGPTITLFEVRLAPGTKANSLSNIDTDLARALKASKIRIVPNMTGKDTVGVEVPNRKKEQVRLKELMSAEHEAVEKMSLPMFLGKDASGNPLVQDLAKMPHMLVAGTTGSGKSVCESSIIMSLLYTRRPDEVKMVLVDPKVVEMSMFKDVPHLMCPVVTEMSKAAAILEWAVTKMDERYELLAEAGVRDIASYNKLGWEKLKQRMQPADESEEARIPKKLPYLIFVIDELADLMMTNKEVEGSIVRIAQKARAVGIHLILATQRPQANVVTGLIKSNMPCRIAFKVASGMDSRIVLDQKGGELLLGQGDMLYLSPASTELIRAQGTLVDDEEVRETTQFLKNVAEQHFEPQLVQMKSGSTGGGGGNTGSAAGQPGDAEENRDPLFESAVQAVLDSQRGSVSLLQRRLTIGYGRAARLIEQMADAGIIGEYQGSQARQVLIDPEEWEAMKAQAQADAAAMEQEGTLYEESDGSEWDDEATDQAEAKEVGSAVPDELDGEYRA